MDQASLYLCVLVCLSPRFNALHFHSHPAFTLAAPNSTQVVIFPVVVVLVREVR